MDTEHGAENKRIRLGMVGGGEGAFIGAVHRIAARLDDNYCLLSGALASTPERSTRSGQALGLDPSRVYVDYQEMARAEAGRDDGIEAVAITTPNHLHAPIATAFLKAGIHVICDKPLAMSLSEGLSLGQLTREKHLIFAVTYNYSGYPMVRHAREMVRGGEIGSIRAVQINYLQDWLTEPIERAGDKQAEWRTDPQRSGSGGCIADIGTHAFHLADYILGMPVAALCAELTAFVPGRVLDDNAQVMLRYQNGARGLLWATQIAPGNHCALSIRIYGSLGGLCWNQEQPNQLQWSPVGQSTRIIERGSARAKPSALRSSRIPAGHPEGYLEAFANIYTEVAQAIRQANANKDWYGKYMFPTVEDGICGMAFVEAALNSSKNGGVWTPLAHQRRIAE